MAVNVIPYLQAIHLTSCLVSIGAPNASGVLVFGTAVDISNAVLKRFVSLEVTPRQVTEQIRNSDSPVDNNAVEYVSWQATLTELDIASGVSAIVQAVGSAGSSHMRIEATYAYGTTGVRMAVAGLWTEAQVGLQGGQNAKQITVIPSGVLSGGGTCYYVGALGGTVPF